MKIALIGYGKLGKEIERAALEKGHAIIAKFSSKNPLEQSSKPLIEEADICIETTNPACCIPHIRLLASWKKNTVVGTTGWYAHLQEIREIVNKERIGLLYAPNFSLGMNFFMKIVKEAAKLLNTLEDCDAAGYEIHHKEKKDSPSGTAKALAETVLHEMKRKERILYGSPDRQIMPEELQFSSLRCGSQPGTHTISFDTPQETIELTHRLRNRNSLAQGALAAAEWLRGKEGLYSMQDMLNG